MQFFDFIRPVGLSVHADSQRDGKFWVLFSKFFVSLQIRSIYVAYMPLYSCTTLKVAQLALHCNLQFLHDKRMKGFVLDNFLNSTCKLLYKCYNGADMLFLKTKGM